MVTLFVLGAPLVLPGTFIWPLALLSAVLLAGAIGIALSGEGERRAITYIFAWTCGFLILADTAILMGWTIFYWSE